MIEYKRKYYINISPRIYVEVNVSLEKGELVIKPTRNKIELNSLDEVKSVNKDDLKKSLEKKYEPEYIKSDKVQSKKRYE